MRREMRDRVETARWEAGWKVAGKRWIGGGGGGSYVFFERSSG